MGSRLGGQQQPLALNPSGCWRASKWVGVCARAPARRGAGGAGGRARAGGADARRSRAWRACRTGKRHAYAGGASALPAQRGRAVHARAARARRVKIGLLIRRHGERQGSRPDVQGRFGIWAGNWRPDLGFWRRLALPARNSAGTPVLRRSGLGTPLTSAPSLPAARAPRPNPIPNSERSRLLTTGRPRAPSSISCRERSEKALQAHSSSNELYPHTAVCHDCHSCVKEMPPL